MIFDDFGGSEKGVLDPRKRGGPLKTMGEEKEEPSPKEKHVGEKKKNKRTRKDKRGRRQHNNNTTQQHTTHDDNKNSEDENMKPKNENTR